MPNNRNRILALLKLLYNQTDENNHLKASNILALLEQQGFKCDRRSFYDDRDALIAAGIDIRKDSGYYIASRKFELAEIKFFVDYIASSETLTLEQSENLKDKLLSLLSVHKGEMIDEQFYINPNIKNDTDNNLQFIIHELVNAIYNQKQIRFQYHNKPYIFSPYSLVSNNQRYYLVGYNHYAQKIYHLKVEKIQELEVTNNQAAPICEVSEYDDVLDVADYMMKTYNMYSGEQTKVKLRFTSKIFDEMKKHFDNPEFKAISKDCFETEVEASVSDGFISFVLSMRDNIQIIEPEWVVDKVKKQAQNILNMYN